MKKFAIIGGGQCGLHLALGLLDHGHDVTLYNDRNPEQLLASRIQSTAFLFNRTLEMERRLGLNFWEHEAPLGEGMLVDFRDPGGKSILSVAGRLHEKSGQALDQRTKFARWMQEFERRGGKLVIRTVSLDDLEQIAAEHTLTFIAAGKGAVNALFERDAERSRHHAPPRQLAALLLRGPKLLGERPWPKADFCPLRFNFIMGVGEFFSLPFYTHTAGECRSFLFEARPGGPMDRFGEAADGQEMLAIARQVLREYAPDDAAHLEDAKLTDPNAWLKGAFTPTIRKPVGTLPSGRVVMGVGDTVCLNDPIAGQGANNASRMAEHLLQAIAAAHGEGLEAAWIQSTFDAFWENSASYTSAFTNLLLEPPGEAVMEVLGAAARHREIADAFMGCFETPRDFWPWIADPDAARQFVARSVNHAA